MAVKERSVHLDAQRVDTEDREGRMVRLAASSRERNVAEAARVRIAQLESTRQGQDEMRMWHSLFAGGMNPESPGHAKVNDQYGSRLRQVEIEVEVEEKILAESADALDSSPDGRAAYARTGDLNPAKLGASRPNPGDLAAKRRLESAPNGLDLWQLRHSAPAELRLPTWRTPRR